MRVVPPPPGRASSDDEPFLFHRRASPCLFGNRHRNTDMTSSIVPPSVRCAPSRYFQVVLSARPREIDVNPRDHEVGAAGAARLQPTTTTIHHRNHDHHPRRSSGRTNKEEKGTRCSCPNRRTRHRIIDRRHQSPSAQSPSSPRVAPSNSSDQRPHLPDLSCQLQLEVQLEAAQ